MLKKACISLFALVLAGCGGHGFEGTYSATSDDSMVNQMIKSTGGSTIIIGEDYLEAEGERTEVDEIFVRESNDKRYLIIVKDGEEESFEIIDDETLRIAMGPIGLNYVRQ